MAITEALVAEGTVTGISKLVEGTAKWYAARKGFIGCSLVNRNHEARVVRSAIVCMKTDDDRYLVVQNLHRPESVAPFGGVYKYLAAATPFFNKIEFRPHPLGKRDNSVDDIRGFVRRKNVPLFSRWAEKGDGRETPSDCIYRELAEELKEAGIKLRVPTLRLIPIRTVSEGPKFHEEVGYTQYRVFDVLALDTTHIPSKKFVRDLVLKATRPSGVAVTGVELVSPSEIREGRSRSGKLIAHHTNYFFASRSAVPNSPLFPRNITVADAA